MSDDLFATARDEIAGFIAKTVNASGQTVERLALDQDKGSKLLSGHGEGFSLDELFRVLNVLGFDVTIALIPVQPQETRPGRLRVVIEA